MIFFFQPYRDKFHVAAKNKNYFYLKISIGAMMLHSFFRKPPVSLLSVKLESKYFMLKQFSNMNQNCNKKIQIKLNI